ncbi:MAG: SbcC/MukB-like Walker B domain-containing protein, partial [Stackebrandtia sp.]
SRVVRNELAAQCAEAGVSAPAGADVGEAVTAERIAADNRRGQLLEQRDRAVKLHDQRADSAREAQVARELKNHMRPDRFVGWLLSEALEELTAEASQILRQLSGGQYDLIYSDDNDFCVVDHHDADLTRPVKTLSGGETFAASLSLALAMSEQLANMSAQGACLEAILVDEGFGSLDADTLDQVAATLESLSGAGHRMVGVVTHVPALADRIPVRFAVGKDAGGSHVTRMDGEGS